MVALTPISRTPVSFYVPVVAAAGAVAGLFVGTAQGSSLLGVVLGAVIMAAIAFLMTQVIKVENASRWALVVVLAIAGFLLAGIPAGIIGAAFGWFFGWFSFWLYEGRYRAKVATYLTPGQVLWHQALPRFPDQSRLATGGRQLGQDCAGCNIVVCRLWHPRSHRPEPTPRPFPPRDHGNPDFTDDRAAHHLGGRHVLFL